MSTHLLLESAVRSLVMGAIILVALRMLRIEQVRARRTAWLLALIGALIMPALVAAQIGPRLLPGPQPKSAASWTAQDSSRELSAEIASTRAQPLPAVEMTHGNPSATALSLAVFGYCAVAAVLGLRLCAGLGFALRLRNGSERVIFPFDANLDVRTNARVATPVTVGSSVLLPQNYTLWDVSTLRIVLSHERAHVRQKDFYVHTLAGLHCVLFWFNPFSWWLQRHLSELGEALSDCAAVEQAESRTSYAETLLAFASRTHWPMRGVAMASASNLTPRIERLLNDRGFERSFAPQRRLRFVAAGVGMLALLASTSMVRVQAAAASGAYNPEPPTPNTPAPESPANPASVAAPSNPPLPPTAPKPPKMQRYSYSQDGKDGDKSADEEILAINSDHSKIMFDAGDELPQQRGNYIYFQHDGKPYLIEDPNILAKAEELLQPMKDLHEQQRELGQRQAMLARQQRGIAAQDRAVKFTETPEFKHEMAELQKSIKEMDLPKLTAQIDVKAMHIDEKALAEMQAHLGELQGRVGHLQSEIGVHGSIISSEEAAQMGRLGAQQGKLGEQQARIGEQQRKLIEDVKRQLKPMIEEAIREGRAKPITDQ